MPTEPIWGMSVDHPLPPGLGTGLSDSAQVSVNAERRFPRTAGRKIPTWYGGQAFEANSAGRCLGGLPLLRGGVGGVVGLTRALSWMRSA